MCFLVLNACQYNPLKKPDTTNDDIVATDTNVKSQTEKVRSIIQDQVLVQSSDPVTDKRQQIIKMGDGNYIGKTKQHDISIGSGEGDITLNFQGTDINEFIKVILSDILNYNFLIDPQVSGKVTIETVNALKKEELFPLLEEILAINNAAIIETNGIYQILPKSKAVKGRLSLLTSDKAVDSGYSIKIVQLEYIAAQEMQKILEPFITEGNELRINKKRNLVIISGNPKELVQLQDIIDIFDVNWLRGMSVGLYPLDYVNPKTLKMELDEILNGIEDGSSSELLGGLVRTIALERLNSLLLISTTPTALSEAENWVYRLDRQGEQMGENLYVYNVQNAKAIEIAEILDNIFGKDTGTTSDSTSVSPRLAPGTTPVTISSAEDDTTENTTSEQNHSTPLSVGNLDLSDSSAGSVKIIADDTRNALVILASARDYKMVATAIEKLDIIPLQVLIEASILEITLSDELRYGVEWFFNNKIDRGLTGLGRLDLGDTGLSALAPGFSYSIINNTSDVKVVLNTLARESEVNVLSAPSLMVLNNQTATINVGDEIPVPTRQSISNTNPDAPTVNEIEFRKTGITLEVTPRVNNSGLVTIEIRQEVSNAIDTTSSDINAPTIQQREIESTVAINTEETIVLGGLIQNTKTNNEGGIPGIYKIPILGKLFGSTNDTKRRTELVVLLTPRVIRNNNDAKKITDEFRRKLYSLPPVKKIESKLLKETIKIDQAS